VAAEDDLFNRLIVGLAVPLIFNFTLKKTFMEAFRLLRKPTERRNGGERILQWPTLPWVPPIKFIPTLLKIPVREQKDGTFCFVWLQQSSLVMETKTKFYPSINSVFVTKVFKGYHLFK